MSCAWVGQMRSDKAQQNKVTVEKESQRGQISTEHLTKFRT